MIDYAEYECGCALYSPGGVTEFCPYHGKKQQPVQSETPFPLTDIEKLKAVTKLLSQLTPEFRETVLGELAKDQSIAPKETTISLEKLPQGIKISFARPIAWFTLPFQHAIALGLQLLEASGAKLEKPAEPKIPPAPPITF